jgi:hypothetical protein
MALSINPAVSGVSQRKFALHILYFWIGLSTGALVTGSAAYLAVSTVRHVLPTPAVAVVCFLPLVLVVLHDAGLPTPVPYPDAQVPEWLRRIVPPGVFSPAYGAMLGMGFLTRYTFSAHFAMIFGVAFLSGLRGVLLVSLAFATGKIIVFLPAPKKASISELGKQFDARYYIRRHGHFALRAASVAVTAGMLVSLLPVLDGG